MLTSDMLWHSDGADEAGAPTGELGRLSLLQVKSCHISDAATELVVASEGKCHLFAIEADSPVSLEQWRDAIKEAIKSLIAK